MMLNGNEKKILYRYEEPMLINKMHHVTRTFTISDFEQQFVNVYKKLLIKKKYKTCHRVRNV